VWGDRWPRDGAALLLLGRNSLMVDHDVGRSYALGQCFGLSDKSHLDAKEDKGKLNNRLDRSACAAK
jgi:hypothetical protein